MAVSEPQVLVTTPLPCGTRPIRAMVCRKPLAAREVEIIRRMNRVMEMKVTHIATAVDRNESTV